MTLFYNTDTNEILDYNGLKALYPLIGWPFDVNNVNVDYTIADDSIYIPNYPGINFWERLYQVDPPIVKLKEISEKDALPTMESDGKWYETYTVRDRTPTEMIETNLQVVGQLHDQRELKRSQVLTDGNSYFDSTEGTQNTIIRLSEYLLNEGSDSSTVWKGSDDSDGLPRWSVVKVEDLQGMSINATSFEQKAFKAESDTYAAHLINPYDYMGDVVDAYLENYNNL